MAPGYGTTAGTADILIDFNSTACDSTGYQFYERQWSPPAWYYNGKQYVTEKLAQMAKALHLSRIVIWEIREATIEQPQNNHNSTTLLPTLYRKIYKTAPSRAQLARQKRKARLHKDS